jgi:hypothetical protein
MNSEKLSLALSIIERGPFLMVWFYPLRAIQIPPHLAAKEYVKVHVGADMVPPIHDFALTADGISGTLSFKAVGQALCELPWECIFALAGPGRRGKSRVWGTPPW